MWQRNTFERFLLRFRQKDVIMNHIVNLISRLLEFICKVGFYEYAEFDRWRKGFDCRISSVWRGNTDGDSEFGARKSTECADTDCAGGKDREGIIRCLSIRLGFPPSDEGRLPHSVREMSRSDRGRPPPSAGGTRLARDGGRENPDK